MPIINEKRGPELAYMHEGSEVDSSNSPWENLDSDAQSNIGRSGSPGIPPSRTLSSNSACNTIYGLINRYSSLEFDRRKSNAGSKAWERVVYRRSICIGVRSLEVKRFTKAQFSGPILRSSKYLIDLCLQLPAVRFPSPPQSHCSLTACVIRSSLFSLKRSAGCINRYQSSTEHCHAAPFCKAVFFCQCLRPIR